MMAYTIYLTATVIGVAGIWYLWDQGIKKLLLDYFRERVFELRFELFRLGASGRVPFNSEAYRAIETLQCGLLRFAHRVTFLGFILSSWQQAKAKQAGEYVDYHAQIELKISQAPADVRNELRGILAQTSQMVSVFMALSSLLFMFSALVYVLLRAFRIVTQKTKDYANVIESEAYRAEARRTPPAIPA